MKPPSGSKNHSSILIVDDDEDIRKLLQLILEADGFQVHCASNGREAMSLLEISKPRLMLLDLMMPDVTGEEVCSMVKTNPRWNDIEIFMISANCDGATQARCLQLGASRYLIKPIDPHLLLKFTNTLLRNGNDSVDV